MINRMIGFLLSQITGFAPSRIPPCGVTRSVLDADAEEATTVVVSACVTVVVTMFDNEAMLIVELYRDAGSEIHSRYFASHI